MVARRRPIGSSRTLLPPKVARARFFDLKRCGVQAVVAMPVPDWVEGPEASAIPEPALGMGDMHVTSDTPEYALVCGEKTRACAMPTSANGGSTLSSPRRRSRNT